MGCPGRPIGVFSPNVSSFSGLAPPHGLSGVQIGPGATALTRMPSSIRFSLSARVNAVIGVDLDYEVLGQNGSMLMVSVSGTAVSL